MARAGVNHHAGGFVHHNDFVVLVENVERNVFSLGCKRGARENFDFNFFTGRDAMGCARGALLDEHAASADQFLNARAAQLGQLRGEKNIEAAAGGVRRHIERARLRQRVRHIARRGDGSALTTRLHFHTRARRGSRPAKSSSIKISAAPTLSAESATLNAGQM